ncbi:hypothetical protein C475_08711 [Halosimplex carlsbadense 2-9-1]|uniref:Uncharacterized protein n=1 Tax=Halosimplex carlsbadense 2-9-1 TaxID=797114 RepID=M0CWK9_9EURY|nr:class I SAM-dependent methyltransferase [Halosimplex carlsbadense]ELZ27003.1 hypothetical protein C475_08711 [Halosimplex carlsbadense 2-9-1]
MTHAATRYLESKRSVDDRARSRRVRDRLLGELPDAPRVLEAGCGTGVTVANLVEWGVDRGEYRGIDRDPGVVAFARAVRPRELRRRGHAVAATPEGLTVDRLTARFETGDALSTFADERGADLFVAQAFADLVPLPALVETVETALAPGGLAYLPITFDGGTVFQPDHPADDRVERAYHDAIDAREGRDARAGRHLIDLLGRREGDLLAVDGSDWVVRPRDGRYPADERHFLDRILGFVAEALAGEGIEGVDDWLATRREQLAAGELTYVAHQYDLLYRTPER